MKLYPYIILLTIVISINSIKKGRREGKEGEREGRGREGRGEKGREKARVKKT